MAFLTASWTNLCLFTWAVPGELLLPHLPRGLELDLYEGQPHLSLVAFDFLDTRVLGVAWPNYTDFPEINLRFYVRSGQDRGVVFIRELVPLRLVAFIARSIYNEPYATFPMESQVVEEDCQITVRHEVRTPARIHRLQVTGAKPCACPPESSVEHFFKEHQWGFGCDRAGQCTRYQVLHPIWQTYPVTAWTLDLDFADLYGRDFSLLQHAPPRSIMLAKGSQVSVLPRHAR